jgi:cytochrome c oxidase cbb3-type subunit III
MSSPCRPASLVLIAIAALALVGCQRETRHIKAKPETGPSEVSLTDLYPGGGQNPAKLDPHAREYEGNAYHIAQGQRYFRWFNCTGCHANGGGAIGPALMDADWRYGGDIQHIYASIEQGRPNGMPSFRDVPETQIWEIAAYVRALSGNADKLAAPSRTEGLSLPPINNINAQPPKPSDPAAVSGTTP